VHPKKRSHGITECLIKQFHYSVASVAKKIFKNTLKIPIPTSTRAFKQPMLTVRARNAYLTAERFIFI
jgi:hypothetical protein